MSGSEESHVNLGNEASGPAKRQDGPEEDLQSRAGRRTKSINTSSSRSSVVQRKQALQRRDEKLLDLTKKILQQEKEVNAANFKITSCQRRLKLIGDEPQGDKLIEKEKLELEIIQLEETKHFADQDLQMMKKTYEAEAQLIKNAAEIELDSISDGDEVEEEDIPEQDLLDRTGRWAENVDSALRDFSHSQDGEKQSHGENQAKSDIADDGQFSPSEKATAHKKIEQGSRKSSGNAAIQTPLNSTGTQQQPHFGMSSEKKQRAWTRQTQFLSTLPLQTPTRVFQSKPLSSQPVPRFVTTTENVQFSKPKLGWIPSTSTPPPPQSQMGFGWRPPSPTPPPVHGVVTQPPDKDSMMVQLMSQQLQLMQTSQQGSRSFVDKRLPTFDGDPGMWITFSESFMRSTTKYKFDDDENMMRLQQALQGEAKAAVQHLLANPRNLDAVMESLWSRFGRSEFVIEHCIQKLRSTKKPELGKPETMDEFGRNVEALVGNISAFAEMDYLYNKQLLNDIVDLLPAAWRQLWFEYVVSLGVGTRISLVNFSDWLKPKIEAVRRQIKPKLVMDSEARRGRTRGPGNMNAASGEEEKTRKSESCACCERDGHDLQDCKQFPKKKLDERWELVKKSKVCLCCLGRNHRVNKCPKSKQCERCEKYHHPLLHSNGRKEKQPEERMGPNPTPPPVVRERPSEGEAQHEAEVTNREDRPGGYNTLVIKGCDGPLMMLRCKVKGPRGNKRAIVLLDSGASRSAIKKSLAVELGIAGDHIKYQYSGVTGNTKNEDDAMKVEFELAGDFRSARSLPVHNAVTLEEVNLKPYTFYLGEAKKLWPHLSAVQGYDLIDVVPDVIVGNNNPHLFLPNRVVRGSLYDPIGIRTVLGWTVAGNFDNLPSAHGSVNHFGGIIGSDDYLHELIKDSFSIDFLGVMKSQQKGLNLEEKRAYRILEETSKFNGSSWEVGLLWRDDNVAFPDSYDNALKRFLSSERQMKRDSALKLKYHDNMKDYLQKGYMRKLTPQEAVASNPKKWIIPHFGHMNPNKPGKFRFILDAKAKSNGTSLNDNLLKGPDLIRPLIAVLMNFRLHAIALNGGIAEMFHRVRIRKEDQVSQCLLWRESESSKVEQYMMEVMIFGATSSPASAIFVKNKNALTYQAKYPVAVKAIVENIYVDDLLYSVPTVAEAVKLREQITEINKKGNFVIRKWLSNSDELLTTIPEELRADGVKDLAEHEELPTERVLGLWWDPNKDVFTFRLNQHKIPADVLNGKRPTKRQVCSLVMSLFDPIGLINHYKVKGMMILQHVWRTGIGWDDEVSTATFEVWKSWIEQLPDMTKVNVPRQLSPLIVNYDTVQLHTFVDASEEAYCAVAYLRVQKRDKIDVSLLASKVRVAPLKKTTIPRLELQAALLGSRLASSIESWMELKIEQRYFHSDSRVVLQWIRSSSYRFKEFVANRVGEIQESTDAAEWRWVPTALNVADIATRFTGDVSFDQDDLWYTGPYFLRRDISFWPQEKGCEQTVIAVMQMEPVENVTATRDPLLPEFSHFSSYTRLLWSTAAVKTCAMFWLQSVREKKSKGSSRRVTTAADLQYAEKRILYQVQKDSFPLDMEKLEKGQALVKANALYKIHPVLKNGLLCISGRIGATEDEVCNNPPVLPGAHYVTNLIVDEEHRKCAHQGKETVFSNLRKRFWITNGRQAVKKAFLRCLYCKMKHANPVLPLMGSLPHYRLASYQPAFTFTGVDCFGPFEVTAGRRHEKRWGVLFCCMVSRACHLEIVHDMTIDEMLMAISRFVDTRGRPQMMVSDNGTNFVGASKEMAKYAANVDFEQIRRHGKLHFIDWKFNPPAAPHMGGVWERLIQSVKKCLTAMLKEKSPRDSTLLTCFKSVENILNSRPITYVSGDADDPEPLTPNHLLRGGNDIGPEIPYNVEDESETCRAQWKRAQFYVNLFWRRWTDEYLPKLVRREKWHAEKEPVREGDLVFIVDDQAPRNVWKRGFISRTFPGADGQVRVVEVSCADKKIYKRPTSKICPIGLRKEIQEHNGS